MQTFILIRIRFQNRKVYQFQIILQRNKHFALLRCQIPNSRSWTKFDKPQLFSPDKSGRFHISRAVVRPSHSMRNNTAFQLWGVVKSSPQVWIWQYRYFKRSARLHSDGLGFSYFFIQNIPSFSNLKRRICNITLWKILQKFKNR